MSDPSRLRGRRRARSSSLDKENTGAPDTAPDHHNLKTDVSCAAAVSRDSKWQIPSTSRCLACGKLSGCSCRVRVDPELKRRKLESLLLNTPYMRSKLLKATEELQREEMRGRRRLDEMWAAELLDLKGTESVYLNVLLVIKLEANERENVVFAERKSWTELILTADRTMVLFALTRYERDERHRLYITRDSEFRTLHAHHIHAVTCLRLHSREASHRHVLESHESTERSEWKNREVANQQLIAFHFKERIAMYETCASQKQAIKLEYRDGLNLICNDSLTHLEVLQEHVATHMTLVEVHDGGRFEIESEEALVRRHLRTEMNERQEWLIERGRLFITARSNLVKSEGVARAVIWEDYTRDVHAFFVSFHRDLEIVKDVENVKKDRRDAELRVAVQHLQSIMEEESIAFHALQEREYVDRDLRHCWVKRKDEQKRRVSGEMLQQLYALFGDEDNARHQLYNRMQREMELVLERAAGLQAAIQELVLEAISSRSDVDEEEQCCRQRLHAAMNTEREAYGRWLSYQAEGRDRLFESFVDDRQHFIDEEVVLREALRVAQKEEAEFIHSLAIQYAIDRDHLLSQAIRSCESLMGEEDTVFGLLLEAANTDLCVALRDEQLRLLHVVMQHENHSRSHTEQEEIRDRAHLLTAMRLERQQHNVRAVEHLKSRVVELDTEEERERSLLLHDVDVAMQTLVLGYRHLADAVRANEEERARDELRARQAFMDEDSRHYNEDESLVLSARPSDDVSQLTSNAHYPSELAMQQQLIASIFGSHMDVTCLSSTNVAFLRGILTALDDRRAGIQTRLAHEEKRTHQLQKRVAAQRDQLLAAKEQKETYSASLLRDEEQFRGKLSQMSSSRHSDDDHHAKALQRLEERKKERDELENAVAKLKDRIHEQYQQR